MMSMMMIFMMLMMMTMTMTMVVMMMMIVMMMMVMISMMMHHCNTKGLYYFLSSLQINRRYMSENIIQTASIILPALIPLIPPIPSMLSFIQLP